MMLLPYGSQYGKLTVSFQSCWLSWWYGELEPPGGHWFGIGTQVVIHYDGGAQLRELKSAGGFQSHNAPVVHFGLGSVTKVNRVELHWTDGTTTVLDGEFVANRRYTVERKREEP